MKIGLISDSHDNVGAVARAVATFKAEDVEAVIHAGDFASALVLSTLTRLEIPFYGVYGNSDIGGFGEFRDNPSFTITDGPRRFELGGRKFTVIHDIKKIDLIAEKVEFQTDILIHGHTHRPDSEIRDDILCVNPGDSCGILSKGTVAILDADDMSVVFYNV